MTILYIIDSFKGYGAEKSIVEIALRLKNIRPVFVQLYKGDDLKKSLLERGISVYTLNLTSKYGVHKAVNQLIPIIDNEKPFIIHSMLFRADMVARKLKSRIPEILLVGSFVSNSYSALRYSQLSPIAKLKLLSTQLRDRLTCGNVDYFIANSETIKRKNAAVLGIPLEKITTIYRGRPIDQKPESFKTESIFNIPPDFDLSKVDCFLNVGRLQRSKGQLDLIKAFKIYNEKNPQSVLLIAGEGNFQEELVTEIKKHNLTSVVFLLGYVNDVDSLLSISDYFVFPSYFEGLPGGVIEAIISCTPCIVSNIPEVMECFPPKGNLSFPPGNVEEIYNKMEEATKIDNWEEKTGESYNFAIKNFDIEIISEKYESFYIEIWRKQNMA